MKCEGIDTPSDENSVQIRVIDDLSVVESVSRTEQRTLSGGTSVSKIAGESATAYLIADPW